MTRLALQCATQLSYHINISSISNSLLIDFVNGFEVMTISISFPPSNKKLSSFKNIVIVKKPVRLLPPLPNPDFRNEKILFLKWGQHVSAFWRSVTYPEIWRCEQISRRRYRISRGRCGRFPLDMWHCWVLLPYDCN